MNKKGNNTNIFLTCLLVIITIICQIFRYKSIYIEPNHVLISSISNIMYPITFLLIILLSKKTSFKQTHKTIINTTIIFLIFMFLLTILNNITSVKDSLTIDIALKEIFTPYKHIINGYTLYYPDILNIIVYTLLFYFSHTIILILYEAMEPYTNKYITFFLSMFIPYTLDTLCYTTIIDVFKEIEFNKMILHLTSNFVLVIVFTILMTLIYGIRKEN